MELQISLVAIFVKLLLLRVTISPVIRVTQLGGYFCKVDTLCFVTDQSCLHRRERKTLLLAMHAQSWFLILTRGETYALEVNRGTVEGDP